MKVSICIPQYNRIKYLLLSLEQIARQTYGDIEIVISDDGSTDDTQEQIARLKETYRYPIIYFRSKGNVGYDFNYRRAVELATGEYCFMLGNDDTLYDPGVIAFVVDFLQKNNYPEIGFSNYVEYNNPGTILRRAPMTGVQGTGNEVAMKNYSNLTFMSGVIYKKEAFIKHNSNKADGTIFSQMYMGVLLIAGGCRLFSIEEPLVTKDLRIQGSMSDTYRDKLARSWKNYKEVNAGLPSVMHVLIIGFRDAGTLNQQTIYRIFKKIYTITFPFWILDYKSNNAFPEAIGLIRGMNPSKNPDFKLLTAFNRSRINAFYALSCTLGMVTPVGIFNKLKVKVHTYLKK